jgi:hypothetical protein
MSTRKSCTSENIEMEEPVGKIKRKKTKRENEIHSPLSQ